jgi:hypothetical protein
MRSDAVGLAVDWRRGDVLLLRIAWYVFQTQQARPSAGQKAFLIPASFVKKEGALARCRNAADKFELAPRL